MILKRLLFSTFPLFFLPIVCAETPDMTAAPALKIIENCDGPLVDPDGIVKDTPEYMMRQHMKNSDTIILVCYFEKVFKPYYKEYRMGSERIKRYNGLFIMEKHGRVVQSLKGDIKIGSEFVLQEFYDELPPTASFTADDVRHGKVTRSLTVPVRGDMSYIVFHSRDMKIDNGVITYENRHVDSEYRCSLEYDTSLSKYLKVRPAAIEKNVFEN